MPSFLLAILNVIAGSALAKLLMGIVAPVVGLAVGLQYRHYVIILKRSGPDERRAYTALRQSIVGGGLPARIYSERLKLTLDAVDRFFGDADMAHSTLWPRAFGLRTPAPLWTAPAFDRCLLLALIYPMVTIVVVWLASGHAGPAEHALLMQEGLPGWRRGGSLVVWLLVALLFWRFYRPSAVPVSGRGLLAFFFLYLVALTVSAFVALGAALAINTLLLVRIVAGFASSVVFGRSVVAVAGVFAATAAVAFTLANIVAADFIGPVASVGSAAFSVAFVAGSAAAGVAVAVIVFVLNNRAINGQWQGRFQAALLAILTAACFAGATLGASQLNWEGNGSVLLFLGLLTLLNAPFDWASLGLTRALLRRGLELGGWWPYVLALVDAACAAGVIMILTVVSVLSIQLFDDLVARSIGEGARVLPFDKLFDDIAAHPAAPEFWWVYAMLLSTMIPSLVNLMIGGASLMRGIPWVTKLLLHLMPVQFPARGVVPPQNRQWIAVLLTAQVCVGAMIGIAAQVFLVYVVIGLVLPLFGLDLLELARAVAEPDLPGKVIAAVLGRA
jgi:hypothetical protein